MQKPGIYITREIPQPAIDLLTGHGNVEINERGRDLSHDELLEKVKGRNAVLCMLTNLIDADVLDAAGPDCQIFANYAVGFNNIDLQAATDRGIVITNTPGVLDNATADMAWALLFAVSRKIVPADGLTRKGGFSGWEPMLCLGRDITGKTLGVIGAGRIGSNFARKGRAFDMEILYTDIHRNPFLEKETGARFVDKETLLRQSDFVSLHTPLLPETTHYLGEQEFKWMKSSAVLINTSRGPVVDEAALVHALKTGEIWGAGMDVFEEEPALHPELTELDNVVLTPHIASSTVETRTNMGLIAARNIINVLQGDIPETCVNLEVLEK